MGSQFNKKLSKMNENSINKDGIIPKNSEASNDTSISKMFNLDSGAKAEYQNISINNITPHKNNIRKGDSWKNEIDMDTLVESIETTGLQQNLVVRQRYEDEDIPTEYVLLTGHRRLEALKRLHEKHPDDISFSQPLCRISRMDSNGILSRDTFEKLSIITTNVEVRSLTNEEKIEAIQIAEEAYEECHNRILKLKKEVIDPITKEPNRPLTEEEKELLNLKLGKSRDFIANAMNVSPRKISNLKRINKKLISTLLEAFKRGELQTEVGLILANAGTSVQKAFIEQNTKPLSELSKADVTPFIEKFNANKEGKPAIDTDDMTVEPIVDVQEATHLIKNQAYTLTADDYIKYRKSKEKIEKELKKIEKLLAKY